MNLIQHINENMTNLKKQSKFKHINYIEDFYEAVYKKQSFLILDVKKDTVDPNLFIRTLDKIIDHSNKLVNSEFIKEVNKAKTVFFEAKSNIDNPNINNPNITRDMVDNLILRDIIFPYWDNPKKILIQMHQGLNGTFVSDVTFGLDLDRNIIKAATESHSTFDFGNLSVYYSAMDHLKWKRYKYK